MKASRITVMVAVILMIVGGLMAAIGYGMGGWAAAIDLTAKNPYLSLRNVSISVNTDEFATTEVVGDYTYKYECSNTARIKLDLGSVNARIVDNTKDDKINVIITNCKYGVDYSDKSLEIKLVGIEGKKSEAVIEIPKGHKFSYASINAGASDVTIDSLIVEDELDIDIEAGDVKIGELISDGKTDMDLGAGNLDIGSTKMNNVDIECGAGNVDLAGVIDGVLNVQCGMGNVSMKLKDKSKNHNLYMEAALGSVRVNGKEYAGIVDVENESEDAYSDYNIECSMGNIDINFTED